MTKDMYFDMCDQLGTEPIEEEIPLDYTDFPELVQTCLLIYSKLQDNWDSMGGAYLGKDYYTVFNLFNVYDIVQKEEQQIALDFLQIMDNTRSKIVSDKLSAERNAAKTGKPR